MTAKLVYPELKDKLILPLKVINAYHSWEFDLDSNDILDEFILKDKNKKLTYISLEFSRLKVTDEPNEVARVVLNEQEQRFEMRIGVKNIKKLFWYTTLERVLRRPTTFEMPDLYLDQLPVGFNTLSAPQQDSIKSAIEASFSEDDKFWLKLPAFKDIKPKEYLLKSVEDVSTIMRDVFANIIQHEFGHIWFWHMKHDRKNCPPEVLPYLNIAMDGLINYHLGINIENTEAFPITSKYVALIPILFPHHNNSRHLFTACQTSKFKEMFKQSEMTQDQYHAWRVLMSQIINFKKWSIEKLVNKVDSIRHKIINYSDTITNIATDIKDLFPEENQPNNYKCMFSLDQSTGQSNKNKPDSGYVNVVDMNIDQIPPQFMKLLEEAILPAAGLGGNMLAKLLDEVKKIRLSTKTMKVLHEYAEKDPSRFVVKTMKAEVLNKIMPTYRPTKHIMGKTMALANSFAKSDPAKFYPKMTADELKSMNTLSLYIDVSGSYEHMTERLVGFIRAIEKEFDVKVWQFSTEIHPMTKDEMSRGEYKTTGGTDGNCILKHMHDTCSKISNFVVFGDREYGNLDTSITFPNNITILDITTSKRRTETWFIKTKNVKVNSLLVDNDFKIITPKETK